MYVLAMFGSGPIKLLPDKIEIICVGILIGGIAGAFVNNNSVPAIATILNEDGSKNTISAINTGAFGLGSILGPILASFLDSKSDFRTSFTIAGLLVIGILAFQLYANKY